MLIIFSEQVLMQYDVDLIQQSKLYPLENPIYPLNIGYSWKDEDKIKMLLYLVSYNFSGLI
jgi:hypothetical protein